MSHSTCTHYGRVDSWLLVVGSQIASLTPGLYFCHNLCYRCPNGSCEAIFNIYTLIIFQCHEERLKARCFDPCNRTLKFWESSRTLKSPFRECECHPHTFRKVRLRHIEWGHFLQTLGAFRWAISCRKKRFDGLLEETKVSIPLWWKNETRMSPNKNIVVPKHFSTKHYEEHATHFLVGKSSKFISKTFYALEISFRKNFKFWKPKLIF